MIQTIWTKKKKKKKNIKELKEFWIPVCMWGGEILCAYLPNSPTDRMWHKVTFLNGVQPIWMFLSLRLVAVSIRLKTPVCWTILLITGGRKGINPPVLRALAQREIQSALSRIWTWVTNFISFHDNLCFILSLLPYLSIQNIITFLY